MSDNLVSVFTSDSAALTNIQTYKGWLFVSVTTIILYLFLRKSLLNLNRESNRRERAEEELRTMNLLLEEKVRQRTTQLEESNQEMEAFISSVSHELRAPLRTIKSFIDILGEEAGPKLSEEDKRLMNIVRTNAKQMQTLIDDLHRLSYVNKSIMQPEMISMKEMVTALSHELPLNAGIKGKRFFIGEMPDVMGDSNLMKQVWTNLIFNAMKFSDRSSEPEIVIEGQTDSEMAVYCVKDNGVGFNPVYTDKLFRVFNRLHGKTEFEGTGVGLSVVKRIIHRHGGRVWAKGVEGKGASFYFALPLKRVI